GLVSFNLGRGRSAKFRSVEALIRRCGSRHYPSLGMNGGEPERSAFRARITCLFPIAGGSFLHFQIDLYALARSSPLTLVRTTLCGSVAMHCAKSRDRLTCVVPT